MFPQQETTTILAHVLVFSHISSYDVLFLTIWDVPWMYLTPEIYIGHVELCFYIFYFYILRSDFKQLRITKKYNRRVVIVPSNNVSFGVNAITCLYTYVASNISTIKNLWISTYGKRWAQKTWKSILK